jgi:hypothetical protein
MAHHVEDETNDFRQVRHRNVSSTGATEFTYTLQRKYVNMICERGDGEQVRVLVSRDVWKDVPIVNAEDIK